MLGFSLSKLLTLIGILTVVWYGFKFLSRVQEVQSAERREAAGGRRKSSRGARGESPPPATELRECPVCGIYVAATTKRCERPDCPL